MINVTSSSASGTTSLLDESARRVSGRETKSNLAWLRRQLTPDLTRLRNVPAPADPPTLVLLLGGVGHSAFRVRVAQSHLRHDLWPSHWSHAVMVDPATTDGKALGVVEVPLAQGDGTDTVPERNGVRYADFERYDDATAYPNIAVLQIPVPADSWARGQEDRESLITLFERQRSVLDAPELVVAWLAFVWGIGTVGNPLLSGVGLPCSAMIETVLTAARFDVSPGVDSRLSCPEAFWQSAKWWSRYYVDQGTQAIAGRWTVTDRIGHQPPSGGPDRSRPAPDRR
jgi:hypothetical protein